MSRTSTNFASLDLIGASNLLIYTTSRHSASLSRWPSKAWPHLVPHLLPGVPGLFHRPFVLDRGDVARVTVQHDCLEYAPHDLPAPCLRQHRHEVELADDR